MTKKAFVATVLVLGSILAAAQSRSLGHGFVVRHIEKPSTSSFESIVHYEYLYYRERELGQVGKVFVSPSGKFALFERHEGRRSNLVLFDSSTSQVRVVTDGAFAVPNQTNWREKEHFVKVTYFDNHTPSKIVLPK
jgi:hypothetical protein